MRITSLVLTFALAFAVGAYAQHTHTSKDASQEVTIIGEVIDPVCYLAHNSTGNVHKKCAEYCVEQGINLAILEETSGTVYVSLPIDHSNPNAKLKDFIADTVKVSGTLYSKGGLRGIYVKNIERATR